VKVEFSGVQIAEGRHGQIEHSLQRVAVGDGPGRWPDLPDEIRLTKRLAGGKGGAEVFEAVVRRGHAQARKVIKLGPLFDLRTELNAFRRYLDPPPSARFVPIEAVSERLLDDEAAALEREVVVYNHAAEYQGGRESATRMFEELARDALRSDAALAEAERVLARLLEGIRGALYDHWKEADQSTTHRAAWNWRLGFDAVVAIERVDRKRRRLEAPSGPDPLFPRDVAKRSVSTDAERGPRGRLSASRLGRKHV
jgi:hypothetical protein